MVTTKENIRNILVEYVKGKYQFKSTMNRISQKSSSKVYYSGIIPEGSRYKDLVYVIDNILKFLPEQKGLQTLRLHLNDPSYFKDNGITKLIIYEL